MGGGGGVPPSSPDRGTSIQSWQLARMGVPPIRKDGVPPIERAPFGKDGVPSGPRWYPQAWDWDLPGVPPPFCERTDTCENITSCRTTYAGGNGISLAFIWQSIQNDTFASSWTITESRSLLNDICTCHDIWASHLVAVYLVYQQRQSSLGELHFIWLLDDNWLTGQGHRLTSVLCTGSKPPHVHMFLHLLLTAVSGGCGGGGGVNPTYYLAKCFLQTAWKWKTLDLGEGSYPFQFIIKLHS